MINFIKANRFFLGCLTIIFLSSFVASLVQSSFTKVEIELKELKTRMPDAEVVIHPESPPSVIELADFVGSTSQMINFVATSNKKKFII